MSQNTKSDTIASLTDQFTAITKMLYTTSVPGSVLEAKVLPFVGDNIRFKDAWQEGGNKKMYTIGMKGFHNMSDFTFDLYQIGVTLNDDGSGGRCMVDGQMNLQRLFFLYTFPLRVVLIYEFRLRNRNDPQSLEIFYHEEMWSYTHLLDGIVGVSWIYTNLFRPAFGHAFVAVSYLSCVVHDWLAERKKKDKNK